MKGTICKIPFYSRGQWLICNKQKWKKHGEYHSFDARCISVACEDLTRCVTLEVCLICKQNNGKCMTCLRRHERRCLTKFLRSVNIDPKRMNLVEPKSTPKMSISMPGDFSISDRIA